MIKLIKVIISCVIFLGSHNSFAGAFDGILGNSSKSDGCPVLFDLGKWEYDRITGGGEYWGRDQHWYRSDGWISGTGVSIRLEAKNKSYNIQKDPHAGIIIYIGPWRKVTLTYPSNFWEEPKQIQQEIRMIATQRDKTIRSHFETKDEFNKDIPEEGPTFIGPSDNLIDICKIKWAAKFGYNGVADYHVSPLRWFTGKVLVGSGEIIQADE